MRFIKIIAAENGAHENQICNLSAIPDGWAVIPDSMTIPDTFPFVNITVKDGVVKTMTAGAVPDPEPDEYSPTQLDIIEAQVTYTAMMTDTLLESED